MATASEQPRVISGIANDEEAKRIAQLRRAERARRQQALNLQRENILSQRTSSPVRRAALESALKEIETQLASLS